MAIRSLCRAKPLLRAQLIQSLHKPKLRYHFSSQNHHHHYSDPPPSADLVSEISR
ncbi:hypothetical protein CICLE_v100269872mg, partial [Citrus x clementina]